MENNHTRPLLKAGDHFGDYVVERLLGKGGMGAVYLVRTEAGSRYAVKVMYPDKMTHDLRVRFAREANFAMGVRHKNLISVYDVGEDPETGLCYIIMDYVPGGSLSEKLSANGRLSVPAAVSIATQIASGLDAAHRRGLVHRDVKPDNILFDADGTPKLADLGIAKHESDTGTMVTMAGEIIGTPAYMSPEQLMDSHRIDARADIYSLGVVLYEMLTGTRPNHSSTAIELLAKAIKGEELPDIRTMRPEISAAVALVISRMCAASPDNRPATALEAAQLLQKAATGKLVLKKKPPAASVAVANERKAKRRAKFSTTLTIMGILAVFLAIGAATFGLVMFRRYKTVSAAAGQPESEAPHDVVVTNIVERIKVVTNEVANAEAVISSENEEENKVRQISSEIKSSKVGEYTWYYSLENGNAVIRRGSNDASDRNINLMRAAISPSPVGRVVVPESIDGHKVVAVGNNAFFECEKMTEVILPDGLQEIYGWGTFYKCTSLKKLVLPPSVEKFHGMSVLLFCPSLTEVDLANCRFFEGKSVNACPKSIFKIAKDNPFYTVVDGAVYSKDMKKLIRWPESNNDLVIPESVTEIGSWACHRCPASNIVFRGSVSTIGESAFSDMNKLDKVTIPEGVKEIGAVAFRLCTKLKSITLPSSLTIIGGGAFDKCKQLVSVNMLGSAPKTTSSSLFRKTDESLTVFVRKGSAGWRRDGQGGLPEKWPEDAGEDARRIAYFEQLDRESDAVQTVIPETQKSPQPLRNTKNAPFTRTVLFPILDRSPTAWAYSFYEEAGWKDAGFNDLNWKRAPGGFGSHDNGGQKRARINTVWQTNRIFLRRHFNWDRVDVTRAVVDIYHDDDVEIYLNGRLLLAIKWANGGWQPVEIPLERFTQALKRGDNVLCVEVRNHGGPQYFDCGLLVECGGDKVAYASPDGVRSIRTASGTWTVMVKDGVAQIGDGQNVALDPRPRGRLAIPSELDGLKIRKLAQNCFKECDDLESVTIPEGVVSVGQGAFFNCRHLVDVSIPNSLEHLCVEALHRTGLKKLDLKNVRIIEDGVFKFCYKLEKISVNPDNLTYFVKDDVLFDRLRRAVAFCPRSRKAFVFPSEIEEIYDCAFQRSQLKSVVIPETVVFVAHDAFSECPFLESVKFKGQDVLIGAWAFGHSPSLKTVILPSRLKALDDWSIFNSAGELESIVLPDTVEIIEEGVFENCKKLKRISLGKSLRKVDHRAFAGCAQLQSIVFPNTLTELGAEVFFNCTSLKSVSFTGNAPDLEDHGVDKFGRDLFKGTAPSLNIYVSNGSTGWQDDSSNLPARWPVDGGESARSIKVGPMHQSTK